MEPAPLVGIAQLELHLTHFIIAVIKCYGDQSFTPLSVPYGQGNITDLTDISPLITAQGYVTGVTGSITGTPVTVLNTAAVVSIV
jgi:hypothetical protein